MVWQADEGPQSSAPYRHCVEAFQCHGEVLLDQYHMCVQPIHQGIIQVTKLKYSSEAAPASSYSDKIQFSVWRIKPELLNEIKSPGWGGCNLVVQDWKEFEVHTLWRCVCDVGL